MERRRVQTAWPRCPWAAPGHCHSPPTGTRTTPEHDIIRPTTTTPGHFRYKTLPAHPPSPHVRYKTLPARASRPHFRYKTLPDRPKWLNLALFLHAGRVLYRCHHQEAEQGEFCTERAAEIEQANTTHQAPPACRAPKEPEGPEGSGGSGGRRARPRCRHPVGRANTGSQGQRQKNFAHNFARSLFETTRKRCNSNDANSMFEQAAGELHAKLLCRRARPRCRWAPTGPPGGGGAWPGFKTRHRDHPPHTHFAHNFPRSLLEIAQKRCNSNDMNSIFEALAGELRAELLSDRAWPGFETTHTPINTPRATGVEGAGGSGGHGRASRRGAERSEALASRAAGPDGARNTSGATLLRWGNRTPVPRYSKRGRREPTPCASALTHP